MKNSVIIIALALITSNHCDAQRKQQTAKTVTTIEPVHVYIVDGLYLSKDNFDKLNLNSKEYKSAIKKIGTIGIDKKRPDTVIAHMELYAEYKVNGQMLKAAEVTHVLSDIKEADIAAISRTVNNKPAVKPLVSITTVKN